MPRIRVTYSILLCCCLAAGLVYSAHAFAAANHRRLVERTWPPSSITITKPTGNKTATRISYDVMKGGQPFHVDILTTADEVQFNLAREDERAGHQQVLDPPHGADITISNGWLYVHGRYTSVGARSTVASAEHTKIVVQADYLPAPGVTRVFRVDNGGGNDRVWYMKINGAQTNELTAQKIISANAAEDAFETSNIQADDIAKTLIQEIADECGKWQNIEGPDQRQ
jgi:hypothetical protein